ncbi:MAG: hypothetical protein M5U28_43465 [Sandaracinaceae bacterium]|nr:hypothetical protein [Sandaracinaceae bacterium]
MEARREGYRSHVQDLSLRFAQRVTIRLQRGSGVNDTRQPRGGDTPSAQPQTPTTPTVRPLDPPPTPRTDPTPSSPSTPGRDFIPVGI